MNEARITMDAGDTYAVARTRPVFQGLVVQLHREGMEAYDFSHTLDAMRISGQEVFEDQVHVNAAGNAVLAQAIFDLLTVI